jgi:hypothetical protein
MPDFETLPTGTQKELILSRELAKDIEQLIKQYGEGIIPKSILSSYNALKAYHGTNN